MRNHISKSDHKPEEFSDSILSWYDSNGRILPWRLNTSLSSLGYKHDPYLIWISEIMLQQTTVKAVIPYYEAFIQKWPSIYDLANAKEESVYSIWAGLGYYSRAKNLLICAKIIVTDYAGTFPDSIDELIKLPGVGPYTSAAILAIAFDKRATVVDSNVERVITRVFSISTSVRDSKSNIRSLADSITPFQRPGDYAQAIMDLGATICKPKKPLCDECPWNVFCLSRKGNIVHLIPKKTRTKNKPDRAGSIYVATVGKGVILVRRPSVGLLPNMLCPPTFGWLDDRTILGPPFQAPWEEMPNKVFHSFTHFNLELTVYKVKISEAPIGFETYPLNHNLIQSLPSLVKKVLSSNLKI